MADVIQLSDGTTTIDLYYDTSGFQMKADGSEFGVADHDNVTHAPINRDGETIVRHRMNNKEWPLALRVSGDDNDDVFDTVNSLGRLAEQARRYEIQDDVDKVYLSVQMDGCSYATYFDVKDIMYNEIAAFNYHNIRTDDLTFDNAFSINVITHPAGYGPLVILHNILKTPGFGEDHDSDGLADNWTDLGATAAFNTTNYLVGERSQQITAPSAGYGLRSDTASFNTLYRGQPFRGYVCVYRSSGSAEITATVVGDANGTCATAYYSTSTVTDTGEGGATWRKLELSGTIGANDNNVYLQVVNETGSATFSVDKAYLQLDTTYMPSEWISSSFLANHYNSSRYFASPTEGTVPYLNVYDIRGDRPAYPKIIIRGADANTHVKFLKITNSSNNQINTLQGNGNGFYLQFTGVGPEGDRSGGSYHADTVLDENFTEWTKIQDTDLSVTDPRAWIGEVIVMSSMHKSDSRDAYVRGNFAFASEDYQDNFSEVTYTVENEWRLVTTGPLVVPNLHEDSTVNALAALEIKYAGTDTGYGDINVDFALFAPISDGYIATEAQAAINGLSYAFVIDNENRKGYTADYTAGPDWSSQLRVLGRSQTGIIGQEIRLIPNRPNKMFILGTETNNVHDIDTGNIEVELQYRPQTRFLLGDS